MTDVEVIENLYSPLLRIKEQFHAVIWELKIQVKNIHHLGGNETCQFGWDR